MGGGTFLLVKQLWQVNLDIPKSCWDMVRISSVYCARPNSDFSQFYENGFIFGAVVWLGMALDYGSSSMWNQ